MGWTPSRDAFGVTPLLFLNIICELLVRVEIGVTPDSALTLELMVCAGQRALASRGCSLGWSRGALEAKVLAVFDRPSLHPRRCPQHRYSLCPAGVLMTEFDRTGCILCSTHVSAVVSVTHPYSNQT